MTLVCVSGIKIDDALFALKVCADSMEFASMKLIGVQEPRIMPAGVTFERAENNQLDSIDAYSHYVLYDLWRHVETEHCLVVQADGYILNPESWSDDFLNFDYIGAPWFISDSAYIDPFGNHQQVGNGGFSLRSKKLLTTPNRIDIPWDVNAFDFYKHMGAGLLSEDGNICVHNRHLFEADGCVFAPVPVAAQFSIENRLQEHKGIKSFGYHKHFPSLLIALQMRLKKRAFLRGLR